MSEVSQDPPSNKHIPSYFLTSAASKMHLSARVLLNVCETDIRFEDKF